MRSTVNNGVAAGQRPGRVRAGPGAAGRSVPGGASSDNAVMTARYAVLLRGINLGRARRVGMADLREALTGAGYGNVRTLLQSGNVVLDADAAPGQLAPALERVVEERFGFAVD